MSDKKGPEIRNIGIKIIIQDGITSKKNNWFFIFLKKYSIRYLKNYFLFAIALAINTKNIPNNAPNIADINKLDFIELLLFS